MEPAQLQELARWRNEDWQPDEAYLRPFRSATKLVAIGGCGRSGSTLLRHMLGAHSLIADGPESSLFLPVPLDLPDLSVRFDLPLDELQALERSSPGRGAFIDGFQALYLRKRGRRLWLDKTSRNVHCFRYIASRFPNAKLLHIVRDPRDTVCSLRTHPVVRKRDPSRGLTGWMNPLDECKVFNRGIESGLIEPSGVYELSSVLFGAHAGERFTGRILVNPIGMAIEDVLVARAVHRIVESGGVTERFTLG